MVGQMVLAAASPAHRDRSLRSIKDYCQLRQIEPRRVRTELGVELLDVLRHPCRNIVEYRGQAFVTFVSADLLLKLLNFIVEPATLRFQFGKILLREERFQKQADTADPALLRVPIWAMTSFAEIAADNSASFSLISPAISSTSPVRSAK